MSHSLITEFMLVRTDSPISKLILLKLADNADNYGRCFPSYRYLAKYCEISERTVKDHVKRLESLGFVEKIKRFDKRGRQRSNLYQLHLLDDRHIENGYAECEEKEPEISSHSKKSEAMSRSKINVETDIAVRKSSRNRTDNNCVTDKRNEMNHGDQTCALKKHGDGIYTEEEANSAQYDGVITARIITQKESKRKKGGRNNTPRYVDTLAAEYAQQNPEHPMKSRIMAMIEEKRANDQALNSVDLSADEDTE